MGALMIQLEENGSNPMNSSDYNDELPCDYTDWEHSSSVVPVLYMLVFVFGLSGNGVVICTVWRSRTKRRSADIYIGNLALADLAFVVTLPLWAVYAALDYHWPFGWFLCKVSSYLVMINMYASVFCLTCLSFDRYLAIVHSLSSNKLRSRRTTLLSLALIWFLAGFLALPALLLRRTQGSENQTTCAMDYTWVASESTEHFWLGGISLFASTMGFLLPFLLMSTFYCAIGNTVTRHFQNVKKEEQKKKRLLKIISALVLVFAICWLPFHIIKTIDAFIWLDLIDIPSCSFDEFIHLAHPYATCVAYINSCLNPFLYAFFDQRFRSQCLCVLRCSRLKKALHAPITSISSSMSNPTKTEAPSSATKV
ncbi:apelin receptor A [Carcharodon carcharias]|uniref:apelin receptor A n=1 Tax=Carcharodon carcharias TaxID=13397 RepID=UPI001B7F6C44|nr:apelin receptor A [Carcharodon carcharias]